jgi:hypothetical protein
MTPLTPQQKNLAFQYLVPLLDADLVFKHVARPKEPLDKIAEPMIRQRIDSIRKNCKIVSSRDFSGTDLTYDRSIHVENAPQMSCPNYFAQEVSYQRSVDERRSIEEVSGTFSVYYHAANDWTEYSGMENLRLEGSGTWILHWDSRDGQRDQQTTMEIVKGAVKFTDGDERSVQKKLVKEIRYMKDRPLQGKTEVIWKVDLGDFQVQWREIILQKQQKISSQTYLNGELINSAEMKTMASKVRSKW